MKQQKKKIQERKKYERENAEYLINAYSSSEFLSELSCIDSNL